VSDDGGSVIGICSERLSAKSRAIRGVLGVAGILGLLATFLIAPEEMPFSPCVFRELTGHSCLTCGLTRSLHAVAHGDVIASLRFHLLGPLLFAGVALSSALWSFQGLSGRTARRKAYARIGAYSLSMLAVLWIVYGFGRMIVEYLA